MFKLYSASVTGMIFLASFTTLERAKDAKEDIEGNYANELVILGE